MRKILSSAALAAMVLPLLLAWGADSAVSTATSKKKQPAKKSATGTAGTLRKPAARGVTVAKKAPVGKKAVSKKAPVKRTTWRNRQLAPTPDRYKEIQGALAAKGYLRPEDANGSWNQASVEALTKFQSEQNLGSTGKINSLSLIALGLGPKHDTAQPSVKPEPVPVRQ